MKIILKDDIFVSTLDITFPKNVELTVITYKGDKLIQHPEKMGMFTSLPRNKNKYTVIK